MATNNQYTKDDDQYRNDDNQYRNDDNINDNDVHVLGAVIRELNRIYDQCLEGEYEDEDEFYSQIHCIYSNLGEWLRTMQKEGRY